MRRTFGREFYIPEGATRTVHPDITIPAECWLASHTRRDGSEGWHLLAFGGKRNKPDANYTFRTLEAAQKYMAEYFDGQSKTVEVKRKWAQDRNAGRCHSALEAWNKAKSGQSLSAADVAVCLRAVLAREFPGVSFSVRSERGLNVYWTDGPSYKAVDAIASCYSFQGFDGMIDLRYHKQRWLSQDGRMSLAHTNGTKGSMGVVSDGVGSPHSADCVLCDSYCDFVFCNHSLSFEVQKARAIKVCSDYGVTIPEKVLANENELARFTNTTRVHDEYLSCLIHRESER